MKKRQTPSPDSERERAIAETKCSAAEQRLAQDRASQNAETAAIREDLTKQRRLLEASRESMRQVLSERDAFEREQRTARERAERNAMLAEGSLASTQAELKSLQKSVNDNAAQTKRQMEKGARAISLMRNKDERIAELEGEIRTVRKEFEALKSASGAARLKKLRKEIREAKQQKEEAQQHAESVIAGAKVHKDQIVEAKRKAKDLADALQVKKEEVSTCF